MKTQFKLAFGALLASAAFAALPAQAQVAGGLATLNPTVAVGSTKAYQTALTQIGTQYKASFDQVNAKAQQAQTLLAQLDKNGDKKLSDDEIQAARNAKNPALASVEQINKDIDGLRLPAQRAQLYAVEMLLTRYSEAERNVIAAKKIAMLINPDSVMYAPDAADVTQALTAELDKLSPSVSIAPPANWQPNRQTVQLAQQIEQFYAAVAQQQAAQRPAGAAPAPAPAPAGAKPAPQGR